MPYLDEVWIGVQMFLLGAGTIIACAAIVFAVGLLFHIARRIYKQAADRDAKGEK